MTEQLTHTHILSNQGSTSFISLSMVILLKNILLRKLKITWKPQHSMSEVKGQEFLDVHISVAGKRVEETSELRHIFVQGDNDRHCHWLNYGPRRYLDVLLVSGMLLSIAKGTLQRWQSEGFTEIERLSWFISVTCPASFPIGQVNVGVLDLDSPKFLNLLEEGAFCSSSCH